MIDHFRIPVIALGGCIEHYTTAKDRNNRLHAFRHFVVPELQLPAILFFPVLVEIDQYVQAAFQVQNGMMVEVGMNGEMATVANLMKSTANIVWVWDEALNSRDVLQHLDEWS